MHKNYIAESKTITFSLLFLSVYFHQNDVSICEDITTFLNKQVYFI